MGGTMSSGSNDQTWVDQAVVRIQRGLDVEGQFGLLFKHFEPRCRILLGSFGLKRDLEDLVQDAMWRVYNGIGTFRFECSFDTWIGRIVKNVARNAIRDRNTGKVKATRASLDEMLTTAEDRPVSLAEPRSVDPSPLEQTLDAEQTSLLETAFRKLPPRMRQCILFYYVHDLRLAEIARLQGVSIHTVKKQLVEGRKQLRPLLGEILNLAQIILVFLPLWSL